MRGCWVIIFLVFLLTSDIIRGQETIDSVYLPQLNIKAAKSIDILNSSSFLIEDAKLRENKSLSLAEVLSRHTPIFIKTYGLGGLATASFRGTTASHTKVFWEGMNINSPMVGQSDLSLLPIFFIDQLSVFPGSTSLSQGGGAFGGAISLNSKPDWGESRSMELMQEVGSFSSVKSFLKLKQVFGKNQIQVRLFRESAKNDFPFRNTASGRFEIVRQKNAEVVKMGGLLDFYHILNNRNEVSAHLWLQKGDRNLPPIMSYAGMNRREFQLDEEARFISQWRYFNENFSSTVKVGGAKISNEYHLSNETPLGAVINYDSRSEMMNFFGRWEGQLSCSSDFAIKFRGESRLDKVEIFDKKSQLGYGAFRTTGSLQVSGHKTFGRVKSYLLLQQEIVSDNKVPLIYAIGAELPLDSRANMVLSGNMSKNYNIPSLNDLYWIPGGNRELKPERGHSGDIIIKYKSDVVKDWQLEMSTSLFAGMMNDWILWRPGEFRFWTAENVQKVFVRGLEVSASAGYTYPLGKINIGSLYSLTKTTDETDKSGAQLIYIPIHKGNVYLGGSLRKWSANYMVEYTGERFTNPENRFTRHRLPAFYLHSLNVQREIDIKRGSFSLNMRIQNLMNTSYQAILWRAMPGRYFSLGVNMSL